MKACSRLAVAAIALVTVAVPALAQESQFGPDDAKETYYWISNKANLPLFVQYDYAGMKRIAEELGVKVSVAGPTDFDLPGFIAAVDQVCAQKPTGVVVVGGWDPSLTESVNKCMEMGVPTVLDDGDLPTSKRLAHVGSDWRTIGQQQAKTLMKALPDGGKVATLSIINSNAQRDGVSGFVDYITANGGGKYEVVASEDDAGDAAKAAEVTAALLAAHPDIAGLVGMDSESGAGIVRALEEAGKQPGDIKVTAMEQTPDFFNTVAQGWTDGIIVQNRELFIYYAVRLLHDYYHNGLKTAGLAGAEGGVPIPQSIDTGVLVVDKDNVAKIIAAIGK
jgi:ABC-type sugar transport system substrate-binding protein